MLQKLRTTVKEDLETPLKKFQDSQPPTFTHTSHSNQSSTTTTGTSKCPATIQSSKVTKPCTSPTISSEEHHRANKRPVSVYRSSSRSYRRDFFDFVLYHAPLAIISKRMILLTNPGRHNPTTGRPNPMAGPSPNTAKGGLIPVISNKTTRKGKPPIRAGGMHRTTSPMILTISYNTQPSTAARPSAAPYNIQEPYRTLSLQATDASIRWWHGKPAPPASALRAPWSLSSDLHKSLKQFLCKWHLQVLAHQVPCATLRHLRLSSSNALRCWTNCATINKSSPSGLRIL